MPFRPERLPVRHSRPAFALATVAVAAVLALTGCTAPPPAASPPAGSTTSTPSATASEQSTPASPAPAAQPTLVPGGSAEDNLAVFSAVTAAVWATPEQVTGRAYIDALAAVGFDKAAMQVTFDETTVGNPAESIQFSVLWGNECVIGQVGPATGSPVTVVVPALGEGTCLVGSTRPIDW